MTTSTTWTHHAVRRAGTQWERWSTTIRLVVDDPAALPTARKMLHAWLDEVEQAASRFRPDTEVSRIAASGASEHRLSPLLAQMLAAALGAADASEGRVDPTVGAVITRLESTAPVRMSTVRHTTWRDLEFDGSRLRMPRGTLLDLGATGKAFAADRAAEVIAEAVDGGVMVSLGGDLRTAGSHAPWTVLVHDGENEPASLVDLPGNAALATSSTLHRHLGPARLPHVLDPDTCRPVSPLWRTVSTAATTCVEANTWATAGLVAGPEAPDLLAATDMPARLVEADGSVRLLGGWPR